jgi:pilus assembly protein Flp/PilA
LLARSKASQSPEHTQMEKVFKNFFSDESGATAIEYGLIAAFIFLAIILVVTRVGTALSGTFTKVSANLS